MSFLSHRLLGSGHGASPCSPLCSDQLGNLTWDIEVREGQWNTGGRDMVLPKRLRRIMLGVYSELYSELAGSGGGRTSAGHGHHEDDFSDDAQVDFGTHLLSGQHCSSHWHTQVRQE